MDGRTTLCVFLALVAVCHAQDKCCLPDQYEIITGRTFAGVKGGVPQIMQIDELTGFDYTNRRSAQVMDVFFQGKRYKSHVIYDYKKEVQYSFEPESQNCQKTPLDGPMRHCLPDNAVYDGSLYIGENQLTEKIYRFYSKDKLFEGNVTAAVTTLKENECIVVGGLFIGTMDGTPTLESFGGANFTRGIRNPDMYFKVPDYCSKSFTERPSMKMPIRMTIF